MATSPDTTSYPFHHRIPKQKKPKKPYILPAALLLGGLLAGGVIGAGSRPAPVTQTVEKRVEVKVPATPAACIKALDLSEQVISYASEALGYSSDSMKAAGRLDAATIYANNDKVNALTPKVSALSAPLTAAKDECRASK